MRNTWYPCRWPQGQRDAPKQGFNANTFSSDPRRLGRSRRKGEKGIGPARDAAKHSFARHERPTTLGTKAELLPASWSLSRLPFAPWSLDPLPRVIAAIGLMSPFLRWRNPVDTPAVDLMFVFAAYERANPRPGGGCRIQQGHARLIAFDLELAAPGEVPERGSALLPPHTIRLAVQAADPLEFPLQRPGELPGVGRRRCYDRRRRRWGDHCDLWGFWLGDVIAPESIDIGN